MSVASLKSGNVSGRPSRGLLIASQSVTAVDANLWEVNAPLKVPGLRMNHRMTLVRLSSGDLVVHSPVRYSAALRDAILQLGAPTWFVAPSRFHDLFWPEWFGAFPQARFVAVAGMEKELPELPFTHSLTGNSNFWDGELVPLEIRGMPKINEVALLHPATRSLIVADLVFNIDTDAQNILGKLFLRLNGIYRRPGVSRLFRAYIRDKAAVRDSLQDLLSHDFSRVILGHGPNVEKSVLVAAAKEAPGS